LVVADCAGLNFDMTGLFYKVGICTTFLLLAAPGTSVAAESTGIITKLSGKVLLNQGNGFKPADTNLELKTGDTLMVGIDSAAQVFSSAQGCSADFSTPDVVSIGGSLPCVDPANPKSNNSSSGGSSPSVGSLVPALDSLAKQGLTALTANTPATAVNISAP
jgi:hypothetical protein